MPPGGGEAPRCCRALRCNHPRLTRDYATLATPFHIPHSGDVRVPCHSQWKGDRLALTRWLPCMPNRIGRERLLTASWVGFVSEASATGEQMWRRSGGTEMCCLATCVELKFDRTGAVWLHGFSNRNSRLYFLLLELAKSVFCLNLQNLRG